MPGPHRRRLNHPEAEQPPGLPGGGSRPSRSRGGRWTRWRERKQIAGPAASPCHSDAAPAAESGTVSSLSGLCTLKGIGLPAGAVSVDGVPRYGGGLKSRPRDYLVDPKGGEWPGGAMVADPPPEALLALHISTVLDEYCGARGLSSYRAAAAAGISQKSMYHLLTGRCWPNLVTILRVEQNLGIQLWAGQHNAKHGPLLEPRPNCYVAAGGSWPDGPLTTDAPPEAVLAQELSEKFRGIHEARHDSDTSRAANTLEVSEATVEGLLNGSAWPDLATIARIERNHQVALWPQRHTVDPE